MGIAVGAGSLLTLFPCTWKDIIVGLLFLGGRRLPALRPRVERRGERGDARRDVERASTRLKEITTAFVVIFIGEFGDLTQIQAANFDDETHEPLEVFLAWSIALICVSFLGAYGGQARCSESCRSSGFASAAD